MKQSELPDILLLSVDSMRLDSMYPYGFDLFPAVSRLIDSSIVFDNCFATSPWTGASFGSVHTGLWPRQHHCLSKLQRRGQKRQGSLLSADVKTLAEILHETGYYTLCAQGNPCHVGRGSGFERGFKQFFGWQVDLRLSPFKRELKALKSAWEQGKFTAYSLYFFKKILGRLKWIRLIPTWPLTEGKWIVNKSLKMLQYAPENRPIFFWFNFMDMHSPYPVPGQPLPKKEASVRIKYFHKQPRMCPDVDYTEEDKECTRLLYNKAGEYVNEQIDNFLDCWSRIRSKRPRLMIFISDHGEEFWDHGNQSNDPTFYRTGVGHGHTLFNELLQVPFIIHWPGVTNHGRKVKDIVSLIDIAPTLLDLIEAESDSLPNEGMSLANFVLSANPVKKPERIVFAESMAYGYERMAAISSEFKLIHSPETKQTELYAWGTKDSEEKNNVAEDPEYQSIREELFSALQKWDRYIEQSTSDDKSTMEYQVAQHLKALGYM